MRLHFVYIILVLGFLLCSCSALKFIPNDEFLYTGAKVTYGNKQSKAQIKLIKSQVNDVVGPAENHAFFGSRPSLWYWFKSGGTAKSMDSSGWLRKELAEQPVYFSQVAPAAVARSIEAVLFNNGFFNTTCTYTVTQKNNTKAVQYAIQLSPYYSLRKINWPTDTFAATATVRKLINETTLKEGQRYTLQSLLNERQRIDDAMKEKGYFLFSEKFVDFKMDTAIGNHQVDLFVDLKRNVPAKALTPFYLNTVEVNTDYGQAITSAKSQSVYLDSVRFIQYQPYIKLEPLAKVVFFGEGKLYKRSDHIQTLGRLNDLGVFKFVNVKFKETDSTQTQKLNVLVELTPLPKKAISMELTAATKSNGFMGPSLALKFKNRNVFRGAELFVANVSTGFETQLSGQYEGLFTYELNPKLELYIPQFLSPIKVRLNELYVPKTKFIVEYGYQSRVNYFDIQSFKFSFGYKWKPNLRVNHDLSLLEVNYFNIYNESDDFLALLEDNVYLQRRFEKQFIEGLSYNVVYSEQMEPKILHPIYISYTAESAGLLLAAININTEKVQDQPIQFLGVNYSQYIKNEFDIRKYIRFEKNNRKYLANRVILGWGLPYGNSTFMPYIKQFFSGGAYSVRGFPAFAVGPGSFVPPADVSNSFAVQQGGEIKLEFNTEYRFSYSKTLKGAFFMDAGNVWLNYANPDIPGGEFKWNTFYKQFAVGAGTGLRADFTYVVLRLDLGLPLHKPWLPNGQDWIWHTNFSSANWVGSNVVLNFAFGYPF